jgi:RNA polymerase sigma factor (sigma-70 family)
MLSSQHPIELNAVVTTAQLYRRVRRRPNYAAESRAICSLAQVLADPPPDILQRLVETAVDLCQGDSAGISIIEEHLGEQVFRWHALTGALASHRWSTTPRDFSPCGTVVDRNAVQLMFLPERHFRYFADVKPKIVEALLLPFSVGGQPVGTIWVVTHDESRQFDAEDERLIKELGLFAAKAYQLASSIEMSKVADLRKDAFLATLARELRNPLSAMGNAMHCIQDRARTVHEPQLQATSELGERQLQSMKRAINDLLDVSTIRFDKLEFDESPARSSVLTDPQGILTSIPNTAPNAAAEPLGSIIGELLNKRPHAAGHPQLELESLQCETLSDTSANRASEQTILASHAASASDTTSLLQRMRAGEQRALEELYDCTVGSVYALSLAILSNSEDAEEVVCDTYAQAWNQSERFDSERASPIGWLMMMCRSRSLDRLRHNRSRGFERTVALESVRELADDAPRPEELLTLFQDGSRVQRALAALSPQRMTLVGLAYFEGLTPPEVAERTGLALGTVKSHIRRALADLRRKLQ